jgi:hypothetical protein
MCKKPFEPYRDEVGFPAWSQCRDTHHPRKRSFLSQGICFCLTTEEQIRRFIHEAEDFVVFSPNFYNKEKSSGLILILKWRGSCVLWPF